MGPSLCCAVLREGNLGDLGKRRLVVSSERDLLKLTKRLMLLGRGIRETASLYDDYGSTKTSVMNESERKRCERLSAPKTTKHRHASRDRISKDMKVHSQIFGLQRLAQR